MTERHNLLPLQMLVLNAEKFADSLALRAKGQDLSYAGFLSKVAQKAMYFKKQHVKKGQKVAIYSDDELEMALSLFAVWGCGAVCMPMNISQKPEKLEKIESIVSPDIGFYSKDAVIDIPRPFIMLELESNETEKSELMLPDPDDIAVVMFTSGTSGVPKAVP